MKYATSLNLALWNALTLGLVALGWAYGFVAPVFVLDASHLTAVIAVLAAGLMLYIQIRAVQLEGVTPTEAETAFLRLCADKVFVLLGLTGTLVGIVMFARMQNIDAAHATADDIAKAAEQARGAMVTAFGASLVGVLSKLWADVALHIKEGRVRVLEMAGFVP